MNWYKNSQTDMVQDISIWLDDLRDPRNPDIQRTKGSTGQEIWVKTVAEAIKWLDTGRVASISLDNDLGDGQPEGRVVADYIEKQAFLGELHKLQWNVHSDNAPAARNMLIALQNADRYWEQNTGELSDDNSFNM